MEISVCRVEELAVVLLNEKMPRNEYSSGQATGIPVDAELGFVKDWATIRLSANKEPSYSFRRAVVRFECVVLVKRIRNETGNGTDRRQLQRKK